MPLCIFPRAISVFVHAERYSKIFTTATTNFLPPFVNQNQFDTPTRKKPNTHTLTRNTKRTSDAESVPVRVLDTMSAIMCCMSAHEERENSRSACWHEAVLFLFPNQANRSLESAATKISPSLVASKGAHLVMLGATLNSWRTFSRHIITILGTFSAKVNQRSIILHTRKLVRGAKRGRSFHPCKI